MSLIPITFLLDDPRFYYPISCVSVVCHWIGYNWNVALLSLSKNHGNHIGSSGLNCSKLFGWNDRSFGDSYILAGCPLKTRLFILDPVYWPWASCHSLLGFMKEVNLIRFLGRMCIEARICAKGINQRHYTQLALWITIKKKEKKKSNIWFFGHIP